MSHVHFFFTRVDSRMCVYKKRKKKFTGSYKINETRDRARSNLYIISL